MAKVKLFAIALAFSCGLSAPALAAHPNLLTNSALNGINEYFYDVPGGGFTAGLGNVPGWTLAGYGFLSYPGLATSTTQQYGDQRIAGGPTDATCLRGACENGFVDAPGGFNFIALDGDPTINSSITQTVSGLKVGNDYNISFAWAAAQQHNESGATTNQIVVSVGNAMQATPVVAIGSRGFSGWMRESFTFKADATSEVVKFLASGTPVGLPPMALLSGGLSVAAVPEPATWAMFIVGAGAVGIAARRRRTTQAFTA